MSNLEKDPAVVVLVEGGTNPDGFEELSPREVPLGGTRAMTVRRTLPQRARSLIGAWCFLDHYGPDDVSATGGMAVPPHPHTGLQTVSWLFAGEIEHRDSVGTHALVRPGELNLMTAGSGIQHSEVSTPGTRMLRGAQLWVALPGEERDTAPAFEHYVPPAVSFQAATVRVFLGTLAGSASPVRAFSSLLGAQIDIPAETTMTVGVNPNHEHGILVDSGSVTVETHPLATNSLGYWPTGRDTLTIAAGSAPARLLLIGGTPLGESIVMWWNFIGRSHDEVVGYRTEWQSQVIDRGMPDGRFGQIAGSEVGPLPAPELPAVRLRARP